MAARFSLFGGYMRRLFGLELEAGKGRLLWKLVSRDTSEDMFD